MITFDFENKEIRQDGRKIGEISAIDSRAESDILNKIQNRSDSLSDFRDSLSDFRYDFLYGDEYDVIWNYVDEHDDKLSEALHKLANRVENEL